MENFEEVLINEALLHKSKRKVTECKTQTNPKIRHEDVIAKI